MRWQRSIEFPSRLDRIAALALTTGFLTHSATAQQPPPGLERTPSWAMTGAIQSEILGESIAAVGDVNGDGFPDFMVGAPRHDTARFPVVVEGAAFLFYGGPGGISATPDWTLEGDSIRGAHPGTKLGPAGDVNGDGFDDLFVGAPAWQSQPNLVTGAVFVFHGGPNGPNGGVDAVYGDADWWAEGSVHGGMYGRAVAGVGDIDDDGFDDLMIAGPETNIAGVGGLVGEAYLYRGSASGLNLGLQGTTSNAAWTERGIRNSEQFGNQVYGVGDVNGDGCDDFALQAWIPPGRNHSEGFLMVYLGVPGGLPADRNNAWFTISGPEMQNVYLGESLAAADLNHDGCSDLIVSIPQSRNLQNQADSGQVVIFTGGPTGMSLGSRFFGAALDQFGTSVTVGDVNGDFLPDMIVGSKHWRDIPPGMGTGPRLGKISVFYGSLSATTTGGFSRFPDWSLVGSQVNGDFGREVAFVGDVNDDGTGDLLTSSPKWEVNGLQQAGIALLYNGNGPDRWECLTPAPDWTFDGVFDQDLMGSAASAVGDVNGDGFEDALVRGTSVLDPGRRRIYLFYGTANGLEATPAWAVTGDPTAELKYGQELGPAGDVNGDGFDDFFILHPGRVRNWFANFPPVVEKGFVQVFHGGPNGPGSAADWFAQSAFAGHVPNEFAASAHGVGDVNDDGFDDFVISATGHKSWGIHDPWDIHARIYLWYGSAQGLNGGVQGFENNAAWFAEHTGSFSTEFGFKVDRIGDFNGDGFDDIGTIAPYDFHTFNETAGRFFVWYGSPAGPNGGVSASHSSADWIFSGRHSRESAGLLYDGGDDLNHDGIDDLAITGGNYPSPVFVFLGGSSPSTTPASVIEADERTPDGFANVEMLPDWNGDGCADLVCSSSNTNPEPAEGKLLVFLGTMTGTGIDPVPARQFETDNAYSGFASGDSLSGGDFNGDGMADVLVGSHAWDPNQVRDNFTGRAWAWYGTRNTILRAGQTTVIPGGRLDVAHYGGVPGEAVTLYAIKRNGSPINPRVVGAGQIEADRCWEARLSVPNRAPSGTFTLQAVIALPGSTLRSNSIEVTVQ